MDTYLAESTRAPWRRTASTLGLIAVLLMAAVGLTLHYRHDHRDEWRHGSLAWSGFDVSADGRTLTFHGRGSGPCTEATGVRFSSDPTAGGQVFATLETRTQVVRDGHPMFCAAVLSLDGPGESMTFDRRIPDGTLISDGASAEGLWSDACRLESQIVRAPTTWGPLQGCTTEG